MSNNNRHDYTKHSNKQNNRKPNPANNNTNERVKPNDLAPVETVVEPVKASQAENTKIEPEVTVTTAKVNCPVKPIRVVGKVVNCTNLNCREEPITDATIICKIGVGSEVVIDEADSTDDFYKICTECGYEGYCMKKYIEVIQ